MDKNKVLAILDEIEEELHKLELWGGAEGRPEEQAFASAVPFFMDTMDFHQWLEYVALPKLRDHIEVHEKLPHGMLIHTYAEEYYREKYIDFAYLIKLLRILDSFSRRS
jgi:uncharacterized protein YqcC (DUF446 family)